MNIYKALLYSMVVCSIPACSSDSGAQAEQVHRGVYTWGPEVRSFKPCDQENAYWVSYDFAGQAMQRYYKKMQTTPYQPMYIEFRGMLLDEELAGFANDYSGLFRISEVYNFTFEVPDECNVSGLKK
ncbi:hypothetical protein RI845_09065 [Thalassotalea nanhaiensis]|uniref:NlpE C-terminal OB domain-containing protein n=1 Tax=Thalassotalea nanhaiensis TaxID=3065648 RepID=A0ABY9TN70_9GAMM|nr:hypothetical protein RI845_09065 [Colwelliaceae bacterium SQ345]